MARSTIVESGSAGRALIDDAPPPSTILDWRDFAFAGPLVGGLVVWGISVAQLHVGSVGFYGLLRSIGPLFFLGAALLVAGFVAELAREHPRQWILALHLVAIVVVIHATVPLVSRPPEYEWVYKHIGVIQTLRANGRVTESTNIYQEWPALFAAVGAIASSGGINVFEIARWSPLAFELLDCLMLLGLFRVLTRDVRVSMLAVVIFEAIISWVGQDYLSPQAFAFLLWLGFVLVVASWLLNLRASPAARRFAVVGRLRAYLTRGLALPAPSARAARTAAVVTSLLLFSALVAAHQLTPYVSLAGVAALVAIDVVRPRWLLAALAVIAFGYLVPRYSIISAQYGGLFSGFDVVQNAAGTLGATASPAQSFTSDAVRLLAVAVWFISAAVVVANWRAPGRVVIPAILAFSPFVVLGGQSYGGEAVYRVFLFSAPWCALLIATALLRLRWRAVRVGVVGAGIAASLLLGMQGLYGAVAVDTFTPVDITASVYLYHHAPPGSALILAADNFPLEDVANADRWHVATLPTGTPPGIGHLDTASTTSVSAWVKSQHFPHAYLVFSNSIFTFARYTGAATGLHSLRAGVRRSSQWALFYHRADVSIYRFVG